MKTDKEYPATHSMWTAWFAIDIDGNVAIMECDDNGPAPIEAPKDETSDSLLLETLTDSENRIKYTDEQLLLMMKSSITPKEYTRDDYNFENIWGNICQINPEKLPLLKEAAAQNSENVLICLSENLNLWYVSFSIPHYLDNSGDSRYRPTKERVEENKNAKRLYKKIFDDSVFNRMVDLSWPLGYDNEVEIMDGRIQKSDSPLTLYFQQYDYRQPSERMHTLPDNLSVKESQLSENLRTKAIRLPLRFSEHDKIQIGEFVASNYMDSNDDWMVDGQRATIAKLPDGNYYFIGNGCLFNPIPMEESFDSHETKFIPYYKDYSAEYRISGKRGFLKYGTGPFVKAGSLEVYEPKDTDRTEKIESGND